MYIYSNLIYVSAQVCLLMQWLHGRLPRDFCLSICRWGRTPTHSAWRSSGSLLCWHMLSKYTCSVFQHVLADAADGEPPPAEWQDLVRLRLSEPLLYPDCRGFADFASAAGGTVRSILRGWGFPCSETDLASIRCIVMPFPMFGILVKHGRWHELVLQWSWKCARTLSFPGWPPEAWVHKQGAGVPAPALRDVAGIVMGRETLHGHLRAIKLALGNRCCDEVRCSKFQ